MAMSKRVTKAPLPVAEGGQRGQKLVKKAMALGAKGNKTRSLLMASARRLLDANSPLSLSAAAISKEAGTSPPTFYVYFENVEDILWALCEEITQDVSHLFDDDTFLRVDERLEDDALAFVRGYCAIWAEHGPLLLYRNMEADRGNKRFNQLVLRIALPILEGITERIVEVGLQGQTVSRVDANAEAVVLVSAIDRIAAALHLWPEESLMPEVLLRAEARVLTRMLRR
ncbi:MAG: TetR/AcrR family transcriptional regulator [Novosphingobium sp.]|nr:MAG: TetR/AcrR family transcriptional regulator [Novosphingobium sp.]